VIRVIGVLWLFRPRRRAAASAATRATSDTTAEAVNDTRDNGEEDYSSDDNSNNDGPSAYTLASDPNEVGCKYCTLNDKSILAVCLFHAFVPARECLRS
jgi:hypothetical protein